MHLCVWLYGYGAGERDSVHRSWEDGKEYNFDFSGEPSEPHRSAHRLANAREPPRAAEDSGGGHSKYAKPRPSGVSITPGASLVVPGEKHLEKSVRSAQKTALWRSWLRTHACVCPHPIIVPATDGAGRVPHEHLEQNHETGRRKACKRLGSRANRLVWRQWRSDRGVATATHADASDDERTGARERAVATSLCRRQRRGRQPTDDSGVVVVVGHSLARVDAKAKSRDCVGGR